MAFLRVAASSNKLFERTRAIKPPAPLNAGVRPGRNETLFVVQAREYRVRGGWDSTAVPEGMARGCFGKFPGFYGLAREYRVRGGRDFTAAPEGMARGCPVVAPQVRWPEPLRQVCLGFPALHVVCFKA